MFDPLQIPDVFRAQALRRREHQQFIPTGFAELDRTLGGGWVRPSMIEILVDHYGIGELQLLMPLLRALTKAPPQPSLIVWLNPPYAPNAVALVQHGLLAQHWMARRLPARDVLWSAEKALRSGSTSAVLHWPVKPSMAALRRIKLATIDSHGISLAFRDIASTSQPSPANLRLKLEASGDLLRVDVIKHEAQQSCSLELKMGVQYESALQE